jgi:sulfite exporter TauE/SafE
MLNMPLIAGLFAAFLHVVSGPDHIAAVTPFAVETEKKVWRIGFAWGLGHILGMLLIGLLFFGFKEMIPVEGISTFSERLVALVLIGLGAWTLYKLFVIEKVQKHTMWRLKYQQQQGEQASNSLDRDALKTQKQPLRSSFVIGFLHGLAGISHFLLLLPILGFETQTESLRYILGFAIGTLMAMTVYTYVLGFLTHKTRNHRQLLIGIRVSAGFFALVIGIYWMGLSF